MGAMGTSLRDTGGDTLEGHGVAWLGAMGTSLRDTLEGHGDTVGWDTIEGHSRGEDRDTAGWGTR